MERIAMNQRERDELDWLKRAKEGSVSQREAAQKMGVSDRWVRKLLKRMVKQGDGVVVHGLRGRPSNRKLPLETQRQALKILKQPDWHDFGPTFASQQLAKQHGIDVSDETVRKWMIEAGLWKSKSQRIQEVHCWRPRRSGFGELVQWDTSEHDWLEGRGPVRYLVRMIDDATSWSWGASWSTMRHRTTWACYGSTWRRMAGWWTSTRTAIRCSPYRRAMEKAKTSSAKQTG